MQKVSKPQFPCKIFFYTRLNHQKAAFNDIVKLAKKRIALLRSIETLEDVRLMDMTPSDDELSHFAC
ncbi:Eukaryotic-type DNA primase, large subunit, partial [Pseudoloma neurophilia]